MQQIPAEDQKTTADTLMDDVDNPSGIMKLQGNGHRGVQRRKTGKEGVLDEWMDGGKETQIGTTMWRLGKPMWMI